MRVVHCTCDECSREPGPVVEIEGEDRSCGYACTDCLRAALALLEGEQSTTTFIGRDEETGDFEVVEIAASFVDEEEE
jgi:hypothetical protein